MAHRTLEQLTHVRSTETTPPPNIPSGAIIRLQDTLCTEAEMLLVLDVGIVADKPNILHAQRQCPKALARLIGYKWGLCVTN